MSTQLTSLEKIVFNAVLDDCFEEYSSSAKEVSEATKLDIKTVKGVLGSLVKKNRVYCEEDRRGNTLFKDVFVVIDGGCVGFGHETYDDNEWEQFKEEL